jgi:hypothetical protein
LTWITQVGLLSLIKYWARARPAKVLAIVAISGKDKSD